jgi:hypothetical protein
MLEKSKERPREYITCDYYDFLFKESMNFDIEN